jgi:hypothetical protein
MAPPRRIKEIMSNDLNETEYVPCMCWHRVQDWMRGSEIIDNGYENDTTQIPAPVPLTAPSTATADDCDYYTHYLAALCFLLCLMLVGSVVYSCWATKRRIRYYGVRVTDKDKE